MALNDFPTGRRPRNHMDVETPGHHVNWVKLFFDLVHVVTIFQLGNFLSHHLDPGGFLVLTGLFLVVFFAWADSSVYISTDIPHRSVDPDGGGRRLAVFRDGRCRQPGPDRVALLARPVARHRGVLAGLRAGRNYFALAALFAVSAVLPGCSPPGFSEPASLRSSCNTCFRK